MSRSVLKSTTAAVSIALLLAGCSNSDDSAPAETTLAASASDPLLTQGVADYKRYIEAQTTDMITRTQAFTDAVKAGDAARARALYGPSRVPWERIEPVAETFGEIDPKVDARENDVEPGTEFTGWHRLERDLWVSGLQADSPRIADQLMADLRELQTLIAPLQLEATQLSNGAKELLDEVATGKVTGEEERYSRLDLVDFQANVDGAETAYQSLRPYAVIKNPELVAQLDRRFADVKLALEPYRRGDSFVTYDTLNPQQVRDLATKVDALSEPLSRLTSVVSAT